MTLTRQVFPFSSYWTITNETVWTIKTKSLDSSLIVSSPIGTPQNVYNKVTILPKSDILSLAAYPIQAEKIVFDYAKNIAIGITLE